MNHQMLIYRFLVVGTLLLSVVVAPYSWCAQETKGTGNKPVEEIKTEYEEALVVRKQKVLREDVAVQPRNRPASSKAMNAQVVAPRRGHRLANGLLAPLIS